MDINLSFSNQGLKTEGKMYDRKIIKDGEEMILKFQPGLLPAVGVSKT